jgi:hypothetical protein
MSVQDVNKSNHQSKTPSVVTPTHDSIFIFLKSKGGSTENYSECKQCKASLVCTVLFFYVHLDNDNTVARLAWLLH